VGIVAAAAAAGGGGGCRDAKCGGCGRPLRPMEDDAGIA